MVRKLLVFIVLFFLLSFFSPKAHASNSQFDIKVDSLYSVRTNGITDISQTITITNKTEFYYTPTYTVSVGFSDITDVQAYNSDGTIPTTLDDKNPESKSIKLSFQKRYAGINKSNTFTLKFSTKDIAKKQGNIWEVTIPGIDKLDDFSTYSSSIIVPAGFGKPSIIKPQKNIKNVSKIILNKEEIGHSGVYILYGDKQYYSFNLKYNISNPNLFPVRTEIAIPSQTSYQNVIIKSFSEKPINITRDIDGNWIAEYKLLSQQKKSIAVAGIIEVSALPLSEELNNIQLKDYTSPKKYWDSTDPTVIEMAKDLNTPKEIYDFVQKKLIYNYKKIATDNLRLGGKGALTDPKNSVCLEFTDLFVTLARSKGIPARSVEGFAFTQNAKLRPLSLVNDILHAWPEYYDKKEEKWIMVDPTWGNTTKEMDYFNSLDFAHVAFVIKGADSEYPIPAGGYKFNNQSKDVTVSFANPSDFQKYEKVVISETFPDFSFPKFNLKGTINIRNVGNIPQSNVIVNVASSRGTKKQYTIDYLPPSGYREITTTFSDIPFLTNGGYNITIQVGKTVVTKKVRISFIPDLQILLFLGGLIGVSTITAAITFHTGSVLIQRRKRKNSLHR